MRTTSLRGAIGAGVLAVLLAGAFLLWWKPGESTRPPNVVCDLRGDRVPAGAAPPVPAVADDSRRGVPGGSDPVPVAPTPRGTPKGKPSRSFGRSLELVTWESIAEEGIPAPPPEFSASPFRWRLKHPIERGRIDGFLRQMKILSVDERTSLLQKIRRSKDANFGIVLLEVLPSVPDNPVTLFDFASAMIETSAAPAPAGHPVSARELTSAALALLAGKVTKYGNVMNEAEWGGIQMKLERLGEVDPGLLPDPAAQTSMAAIRRAMATALEKALPGESGYLGGVHCFRLAAEFGDEGTHEVLCRLLKEWETVRGRFHPGVMGEPTAHLYAVESLLRPPCAAHAAQGIDALIARFRVSGAGGERTRFENRIRRYVADRGLDEGLRRRLYSELGEEFREAPPPAVPPREVPPEPPRLRDDYR